LFIEVGVNLSAEHPWKQISKQFLEDQLSTDTYEMKVLKEKLAEIEDDPLLLIGYVPHLSDETRDTFIIYLEERTCKEASEIIKRMEACERRKIAKAIVKYPRPYQSMGSEAFVDSFVSVKRSNTIDVELQSVYPMRYTNATFTHRFVDDVRDGYVELLPEKKVQFENVYRKMIDRGIQTGAKKVAAEQQTDPTFPTSAWTQYLYELEEPESKTDAETETIASAEEKKEEEVPLMLASSRRKKSKEEVPIEEPKPEEPTISKQVEDLLQILEFNQIDMYRDDYKFIGKEEVPKYQTPYLEEICCFAYISKCKGRHVTAIDWHPEISGICVAAYGFNSKTKTIQDDEEIDVVKRTIIESNPVFVWSFNDLLYPKLELESLREISCISFCPYDSNVIIGGTINGQILIWDIKNRLEKVENEQTLTPEQQKHRTEIRDYLKWSKIDDANKIIVPAATSSIDKSHESAVTSIKWMSRNYQCTSKGILKEDRQNNTLFRQFVTTSFDGKILFWDLEWQQSPEDAAKTPKHEMKILLPDELREKASPFKTIDKIFVPHFSIAVNYPITSFTFNEGDFIYEPLTKNITFSLHNRIKYKVTPVRKESFNPKMMLGTSIGDVISCAWDGHDWSQGALLDTKSMNIEPFAKIHDGPVTHVERNKFMPQTFISVGGNIFALWHDDCKDSPIFWRRRKCLLTGIQWSLDRACVFFLICEDGTLEIWDLNSRINSPALSESLGGNILTELAQHKLNMSKRILAIADFNTNLRMFILPHAFVTPLPDEKENFIKFVDSEILRKQEQHQWKDDWFQANKDIVDAKKDVEQQIVDEEERKERLKREIEEKRAQMAEAEARK
jgi:WD40 repeat protein